MNWVDLAIIALLVISGLLAFMRGLVRELLGIGSWIGAGFFATWAFPLVRDRVRGWLGSPDIGDPAAFAAMFLVAVVFLSVIAGMLGGVVRMSLLGGVDRTLGVVFGLLRGAVLVAFAYIAGGIIVPVERWPDAVLEARSLPYAFRGASLAVSLLPKDYRPKVLPPPASRETRAEDLLRANPQGRAIARP
jgi:membrane protein required for colicin V production